MRSPANHGGAPSGVPPAAHREALHALGQLLEAADRADLAAFSPDLQDSLSFAKEEHRRLRAEFDALAWPCPGDR